MAQEAPVARAEREAAFQAGVAAYRAKQFATAEREFGRCYALGDARGLNGLAETLMAQDRGEDAFKFLQNEVAAKPAQDEVRVALGSIATRLGRWDTAIAEFQKVLDKTDQASRRAGDLLLRIGEVHRRKGDLDAALKALESARRTLPEDARVLSVLGFVLDSASRWDEAKQAYEATLELQPNNGAVLNNLAFGLAAHGGDLDRALVLAQRAKDAMPRVAEVDDTLGWVMLKKNLTGAAINIFRALVEKNPNNATFHYHLGLAYSQKGDRANGCAELQRAAELSPGQDERRKIQDLAAACTTSGQASTAQPSPPGQEEIVRVELAYRAPGSGPAPDFGPYGTQVRLSDFGSEASLPDGAARPAKVGTVQIGPDRTAWIRILATADAAHPADLSRLYIDHNRNGNFTDDGPALAASVTQDEKTKAWRSSFPIGEFSIPYGEGVMEPYTVGFWAVRGAERAPDVIRYSVRSCRIGAVRVRGIEALVAAMDSNNDALFEARDIWSALAASEKGAAQRVLSYKEARPMNRLMFLEDKGEQLVLEFRSVTPEGRFLSFAVVDRAIRKADDRAPDDTVAAERSRPRTSQPFSWIAGDFERGMAEARRSDRKVIVDFWTDWCGPCRSLDEWIWTDAEVAALLNARYVGVKVDGDVAKEMVSRFHVEGYPTILVLDSAGTETQRFGYVSSREMLEILSR